MSCLSCAPVCHVRTRTDFEGNNGKEKAMHGHPFTMVPEAAGGSSPNITTQADVVLTGCPCLAGSDGNSWIGQRDDPQRFDRFPKWCYGFAVSGRFSFTPLQYWLFISEYSGNPGVNGVSYRGVNGKRSWLVSRQRLEIHGQLSFA